MWNKKAKANFKIFDVINWERNNYNTYMATVSSSKDNKTKKFGQFLITQILSGTSFNTNKIYVNIINMNV